MCCRRRTTPLHRLHLPFLYLLWYLAYLRATATWLNLKTRERGIAVRAHERGVADGG